jgi:hypothetical protein
MTNGLEKSHCFFVFVLKHNLPICKVLFLYKAKCISGVVSYVAVYFNSNKLYEKSLCKRQFILQKALFFSISLIIEIRVKPIIILFENTYKSRVEKDLIITRGIFKHVNTIN